MEGRGGREGGGVVEEGTEEKRRLRPVSAISKGSGGEGRMEKKGEGFLQLTSQCGGGSRCG